MPDPSSKSILANANLNPLIRRALRGVYGALNRGHTVDLPGHTMESTLMSPDDNRYSALIKTRAPEALRVAVEMAADRELTTTSAYARKAIINQLRADGIAVKSSNQQVP